MLANLCIYANIAKGEERKTGVDGYEINRIFINNNGFLYRNCIIDTYMFKAQVCI